MELLTGLIFHCRLDKAIDLVDAPLLMRVSPSVFSWLFGHVLQGGLHAHSAEKVACVNV